MRHGESCANLMSSRLFLGRVRKTQYKDPELTRRGYQLALERGRQLADEFAGLGRAPIICSSQLLRAIQTADAISIPGKIHVLPFIQESGAGQDNEAFTPAERAAHTHIRGLIECLAHGPPNYRFFDAAKKGSEPNAPAFLRWLQCNLKNMIDGDLPAEIDMIVVTHSNFLKSLMSHLRGPSVKFDNLDMIDVIIRVDYNGTRLVRIGALQKFDADGSKKRRVPVAPDNCRFKITGTDEAQRVCPARMNIFAAPPPPDNLGYYAGPASSGLNTGAAGAGIVGSAVVPTADAQIEFFLPRSPMLGASDAEFARQIRTQFGLARDQATLDMVFGELNRVLDAHRAQVEAVTLVEADAVGRREEAEEKRQEWLARYDGRRAEIQRAYDERRVASGGARRSHRRRRAGHGPVRKRLTAHRRRGANRRRTTRRQRR
jgi:broad specificity phosphatase PhoE